MKKNIILFICFSSLIQSMVATINASDTRYLVSFVIVTTPYQTTPLHEAVKRQDRDTVIDLLNAGSEVNAQDLKKRTPLHHAVKKGNREITLALLNKGAKTAIGDQYGLTPHNYAFFNNNEKLVQLFDQWTLLEDKRQKVKYLLGAALDARFGAESPFKQLVPKLITHITQFLYADEFENLLNQQEMNNSKEKRAGAEINTTPLKRQHQ